MNESIRILYSILTLSLIYATPIIVTALGGLLSERSGVVNIGLEGLMTFGAFVTAAFVLMFESMFPSMGAWYAIVMGALAGALLSLLHAFICIHLKGDQVISGTGINFIALGLSIFLCQIFYQQQRTPTFRRGFTKWSVPVLKDIPIIGDIFFRDIYSTVFLAFLLVVIVYYFVYLTPIGLRLRASGEHPSALESAGVSVYKIRYYAVAMSGAFAGLSGGIMVLTQDTQFTATSIHGTGFIALAALIFGQWKPVGVMWAALLFGLLQVLSVFGTSIGFVSTLPQEFFKTFPYILTVLALVAFSRNAKAPKAVGIPFERGSR